MSKLNGLQIFELLSNLNDDLIVESVSPALLAGGATGVVAGLTESGVGTASANAAKTGLGAWLAKGGWIALLAAAVIAVSVAVGSILLSEDLFGQILGAFFPDLTETETGGSEDTEEDPTGEDTTAEDTTETVTEEETVPLPTVEDFRAESLLSLFSAEQGTVSAGEGGELVVEAIWNEGDKNFSALCFDPREVMKALGEPASDSYGVLTFKIRREMAMVADPTVYFGTDTLGHNKDVTAPVYRYTYAESVYEYVVVDLTGSDAYGRGATPYVYVEWLGMEDRDYLSEGRRMTVYEIAFYEDIWDAFFAVEDKLTADGVPPPELKYTKDGKNFAINSIRVPFLFLHPVGPDGHTIPRVVGDAFTNSKSMQVAVFHEGFTYVDGNIMSSSEVLRAVYLPDSMTKLEGSAFNFCSELTRVRVGSGMEFIDFFAFDQSVTDIDYNGTMAQWCKVDRDGSKKTSITVHCLDGDLLYSATSPTAKIDDAEREEQAWSIPLSFAEWQDMVGMESTYLTLTNQQGGEVTVLLRWALTGKKDHPAEGYDAEYLFYFDILNAADGSVLYVFDREESLAYAREEGSSLFLAQGGRSENSPQSATLFLTNYGYSADQTSFTVRTTHFRLSLNDQGEVTVNRAVKDTLMDDVTVACPVANSAELAKLRRVFTDIEEYMMDTYALSNVRPARLLLVTRPHGDSAFFSHRLAPVIDASVLSSQKLLLDVAGFNAQTLEYLYERFGVYDVWD